MTGDGPAAPRLRGRVCRAPPLVDEVSLVHREVEADFVVELAFAVSAGEQCPKAVGEIAES